MDRQSHLSQASIDYALLWDLRSSKELVIAVENLTEAVIQHLCVQWHYESEAVPFHAAGVMDAPAQEQGGGTIFEPQAGAEGSALSTDLEAGRRCRFNARLGTVDRMVNRVAALTPKQYRISFQTRGIEFAHIPGSELQAFLGGSENHQD